VRGGKGGLGLDEGGEAAAEIAQCEGGGGKLGKEGGGELHETALAEDGADAGVIVIKAIEDTEPVGAGVNLEALDGGEAAVGDDELGGDAGGGTAIGPSGLQTVAGVKGTKKRLRHDALELAQVAEGVDPTRQQVRLSRSA
jgi:hypothetical protein